MSPFSKFIVAAIGVDWTGGPGNDVFGGTKFADTARGLSGSDIFNMYGGNDAAYGGMGNDWINAGGGNDLSYGGWGRDVIYSGDGHDDSYGGWGDDDIYGDSGSDDLFGGNGHDEIYGGDGNDDVVGDNGNDELFGGNGNDELFGGSGNDDMNGGAGEDDHYGGAGHDTIDFLNSDAGVNVNLQTGTGSGGHAQGDTYHAIEAVAGSDHADVLTGDTGDNSLFGFGGNDVIDGGEGDDVINGGENGFGPFGDIMTGGFGEDTFLFDHGESGGLVGVDFINDFTVGQDTIAVHAPGVEFSGLQFGYVGNAMVELYYNWTFDDTYGAVTHVHMRNDHVYEDDFEIMLQGHLNLTESDFAFT